MMRRGLRDLLDLEDDLETVGEAGNGEDAIRLAQEVEPDLILMDLNMPGIDGLETTRRMRDADIDARIIMFTVSDEQGHVLEALRNGADGYLLKDMDAEQLIEQIRIAATGRMALSPELTQVLAEAIRVRPKPSGQVQFSSLTKREKEVLRQIAKGQSNKMIARKLGITEGTVKVHVKNLLHKLGLRSRVEAAVWVLENEAKG
ncbi:two-component system response regulator NarL [Stutzerimonas frequens]|jgi:two-component system nitrate/nitrite response regulator NarL|uniref:Two-component system response regulator NarL n=1 Tax=Stutzerimonas frequens TaxID=2968969 RepID=A0AA47E8Q4_9GAMM|nr:MULTISPECIES: two-component system response regulator NarL [Stutzerimonas]MDL0441312.1 two-component system response regulator NarL [Stutzerimonas frequens]QFU11194.1 Nitrate/nitrite response regulator protein NarL [Stutzerimonas frequens]WAE54834.1 two-component system response regulator NarL [Stutzerimonas frequens]WAE64063.1 two-component system response regulator NarL [Stutzerimonas sp. R40042]WOC81010.1 two-component system response regulator NarL [Stutzerimonas frequens]